LESESNEQIVMLPFMAHGHLIPFLAIAYPHLQLIIRRAKQRSPKWIYFFKKSLNAFKIFPYLSALSRDQETCSNINNFAHKAGDLLHASKWNQTRPFIYLSLHYIYLVFPSSRSTWISIFHQFCDKETYLWKEKQLKMGREYSIL